MEEEWFLLYNGYNDQIVSREILVAKVISRVTLLGTENHKVSRKS